MPTATSEPSHATYGQGDVPRDTVLADALSVIGLPQCVLGFGQ